MLRFSGLLRVARNDLPVLCEKSKRSSRDERSERGDPKKEVRRFPNSFIPPELVFLPLFCVVEALNIACYARAPRLEDEQKYVIIWYKSIRQST